MQQSAQTQLLSLGNDSFFCNKFNIFVTFIIHTLLQHGIGILNMGIFFSKSQEPTRWLLGQVLNSLPTLNNQRILTRIQQPWSYLACIHLNIKRYHFQFTSSLKCIQVKKKGLSDTSSPDFSSFHFHPRFFIPWLFHPQIFHPQHFHSHFFIPTFSFPHFHPRIFIPAFSSPHFHPHTFIPALSFLAFSSPAFSFPHFHPQIFHPQHFHSCIFIPTFSSLFACNSTVNCISSTLLDSIFHILILI